MEATEEYCIIGDTDHLRLTGAPDNLLRFLGADMLEGDRRSRRPTTKPVIVVWNGTEDIEVYAVRSFVSTYCEKAIKVGDPLAIIDIGDNRLVLATFADTGYASFAPNMVQYNGDPADLSEDCFYEESDDYFS